MNPNPAGSGSKLFVTGGGLRRHRRRKAAFSTLWQLESLSLSWCHFANYINLIPIRDIAILSNEPLLPEEGWAGQILEPGSFFSGGLKVQDNVCLSAPRPKFLAQ